MSMAKAYGALQKFTGPFLPLRAPDDVPTESPSHRPCRREYNWNTTHLKPLIINGLLYVQM